ncbi:MAG: TrmB family transcriptional regulator [Candidatus Hodarchaeales archaeon]
MTKSTRTKFKFKSNDEEITELVTILGLSLPQARVFLELVKRTEATATKLCEETGIKDSRIYQILSDLEQLGLIGVQLSTPKKYKIESLDECLNSFQVRIEDEFSYRKQVIEELRERLTPLVNSTEIPTAIAYIIKGKKNIVNKLTTELYRANKEIFFRIPDMEVLEEFKSILEELYKSNIKMNIGIYESGLKDSDFENYQFIVNKINCKCFFLIIDNLYLIMVSKWYTNNTYAIWTSDTSLIKITSTYKGQLILC